MANDAKKDEDDKITKEIAFKNAQMRWIHVAFCAESCAAVMLTATFNTFHVETFLNEYKLNLGLYAQGHAVYAVINTLNDILGATLLDYLALTRDRSFLLTCGGLLWTICFLLPWYPWPNYPFLHFIFSMSCYDTMYSFCAIAGGSLLTEMAITDSERIQVLRLKSIAGTGIGFLVTLAGQWWFPQKNDFRSFCIVISLLSGICYLVFRQSIQYSRLHRHCKPTIPTMSTPFSLRVALSEFWHMSNFRAWLGMEMCLETQTNFNRSYLRLFATHLTPNTATTLVSTLPLMKQVVKFLAFSVIDSLGLYNVYKYSFVIKLIAAAVCILLGGLHTSWIVACFLCINFIATEIPTGGFTIAMSNMQKELALKRYQSKRMGGPSYSGMFMGLNAVFCKPMDSLLPMICAKWLDAAGFQKEPNSIAVHDTLFYLLVLPPVVLCSFQLWSWSNYTLRPERVRRIENDLSAIMKENNDSIDA